VVLNLAAWADVDGAEAERGNQHGRVYALNAAYPATLAKLCGELGKHLVHVSTDYVFDGTNAERPYREGDPTNPLCWYAETKWLGERGVTESGANACVVRIEMPFSGRPFPRRDVARTMLGRLQAGQPLSGVVDQRITPIFLDDAVRALRLLVDSRHTGIIHAAATDWTTPFRFAQSIARRLNLNAELVRAERFETFGASRPARRPQHSWLDVSVFANLFGPRVLRPVEAELDAWVEQVLSLPSRA
jgi:dTDP-4-dehydrorhamnose reductase